MLSLSVSKSAPADNSNLDGEEVAEADPVQMKDAMDRQAARRQSHSKTVEDDMLDLVNKAVPLVRLGLLMNPMADGPYRSRERVPP